MPPVRVSAGLPTSLDMGRVPWAGFSQESTRPWQVHGLSWGKAEAINRNLLIPLAGDWGWVSPVMFACCDSELGSALVAVGAIAPWRLLGQHICNTAQDQFLSDTDCVRPDQGVGGEGNCTRKRTHRRGTWGTREQQRGMPPFTALCRYRNLFTSQRSVMTLHGAHLLVPLSQQHFLTLWVCVTLW